MTLSVIATALLSALLCRAYLRFALRRQILAEPNERSAHQSATPSGGGIALVTAFLLGLLLARSWVDFPGTELLALSAGVLCLSVIGFVDDLKPLPMPLRLLLYALVSAAAAAILLQPRLLAWGMADIALVAAAALVILWSLNLYNFMDGIDGIAALQAVLACAGAALLAWLSGAERDYLFFCLAFAAAHAGFLVFNSPPARMFMGDAGSVPTGFLLAGLALIGAVRGDLNPLCWLVLMALFVTDASVTLLHRLVAGERFTQAHSSHAYQRLARHWNSHIKVDFALLAISVLWLLPLALAVRAWPDNALILVILAYLPLVLGMAKARGLT